MASPRSITLGLALARASACDGDQIATPATAGSAASPPTAIASRVDATATATATATAARADRDARCSEPCLFLVDTPIADFANTFRARCAGASAFVSFEDCKTMAYLRNCIYAAHGYVFPKRWKQLEQKPWHVRHPEFKALSSELERANVKELYQRAKACAKNLHISGADYERVKAWLAALPIAALPPRLAEIQEDTTGASDDPVVTIDAITPKDFSDFVGENFNRGNRKARVALTAKDAAFYTDPISPKLLAFVAAPAGAALRVIAIDHEIGHGTAAEPYSDEALLYFVYDDHDQLRAIAELHRTTD